MWLYAVLDNGEVVAWFSVWVRRLLSCPRNSRVLTLDRVNTLHALKGLVCVVYIRSSTALVVAVGSVRWCVVGHVSKRVAVRPVVLGQADGTGAYVALHLSNGSAVQLRLVLTRRGVKCLLKIVDIRPCGPLTVD